MKIEAHSKASIACVVVSLAVCMAKATIRNISVPTLPEPRECVASSWKPNETDPAGAIYVHK